MKHGNPEAYSWDDLFQEDDLEEFLQEALEEGEDLYEGWGWDSPEKYLD